MAVLQNRKNGTVTIHLTSNATITVVGNSSVSNVAIDNEVLTGGNIKQVWYGSANGYWVLKRDTTVVGVYNNTGHTSYAATGSSLSANNNQTLVAELVGTANGYLMVELQKVGNW